MKKALIALSGGVDSSVAAYLMQQQGYDCAGVTMKLFHNEDIHVPREKSCCSLEDVEDARSVAQSLGMPFYVFDFTQEFKSQVIDKFIDVYLSGGTPNPCIDCNRYMKFDKLLRRANELGLDYIVTGHYSRIDYDPASGRWLLKKAIDESKDQSYALYAMTQEQLTHTLFPLGRLRKSEIREIAAQQGFINATKRDSQDICFVRDGDYASFIAQSTGQAHQPGNFLDMHGNVLGEHKGMIRYTIGQRKGLGLSFPQPMYVHTKNAQHNTVTLCRNEELFSSSLEAVDFNWIACDGLPSPMRVKAKVRYNQTEQWAVAEQTSPNTVHIEFDDPQRAIAPGQAVVLYNGDVLVGGGTIE